MMMMMMMMRMRMIKTQRPEQQQSNYHIVSISIDTVKVFTSARARKTLKERPPFFENLPFLKIQRFEKFLPRFENSHVSNSKKNTIHVSIFNNINQFNNNNC